jgi:hypothetical protein
MQERFERACAELGYDNVLFYPEENVINDEVFYEDGFTNALDHQQKLIRSSAEFLYNFKHKIKCIIFPDLFSFPHMQFMYSGMSEVEYLVMMHGRKELMEHKSYGLNYAMDYASLFPRLLFQTESTEKTYAPEYDSSYGIKKSFVTGGFLEQFMPFSGEKIPNTVLWAGSRAHDRVKGYDEFLTIVEKNPDMTFVVPIDSIDIDLLRYPNVQQHCGLDTLQVDELAIKCEFVLSTSISESFPYLFFDSVALACIPVAKNNAIWEGLLPSCCRYTLEPNFEYHREACSIELMANIVKPHFYKDSFERMIQGVS